MVYRRSILALVLQMLNGTLTLNPLRLAIQITAGPAGKKGHGLELDRLCICSFLCLFCIKQRSMQNLHRYFCLYDTSLITRFKIIRHQ
jgi:hypothetical protein